MKILISSCLLGHKVRYDGKDKLQTNDKLQSLINSGQIITICPEVVSGLSTPRDPAEIQDQKSGIDVLQYNGTIKTVKGKDVTEAYIQGAYSALALAQMHNVKVAILKARSPSCSSSQIYNGTFSKSLINGMGVTAALLSQHGITIFDEDHIDEALQLVG